MITVITEITADTENVAPISSSKLRRQNNNVEVYNSHIYWYVGQDDRDSYVKKRIHLTETLLNYIFR